MTTSITTGRCLCGDIRFEFEGEPLKTMHCHCESCRRHSSSPFTTFMNLDKSTFRYTRGTPASYWSSPGVERTHCGRCGSPLTYERAADDDFAIYACTLDDPTPVAPTIHVMAAEQLPWIEVADDLPRYAHGSRNNQTLVSYGPRRS